MKTKWTLNMIREIEAMLSLNFLHGQGLYDLVRIKVAQLKEEQKRLALIKSALENK